jgi:hypothetical protein
MSQSKPPKVIDVTAKPAASYEAPRIELLVTGRDMEREVHYAGSPSVR